MSYRTGLQAHRPQFGPQQKREIEILVFFIFNDLADAGFPDFVIGFIRIEQHFRLEEDFIAKTHVSAELSAKLASIYAEVESGVAAADGDIVGMVELGIQAAFEAERKKLGVGGLCGEEEEADKNQIFHVVVELN